MLVKFTDWRGHDVWVNPLQVRTVFWVSRMEWSSPGKRADVTVITLASESAGPAGGSSGSPEVVVRLPVEEVVQLLDDATPGTLT